MSETAPIIYFAYGSNMFEKAMIDVAPTAKVIGTGRLADHRLAFTRQSRHWNAGAADVLHCPGFWVYGVLYAIQTDELVNLDRKEGAPKAYHRIDISVRANGSPVSAMTYTVVNPELREIQPHPDYLRQIIDGAQAHALPQPYLDFLQYLTEQFSSGTRHVGLLLAPTVDRRFSSGEPLIRLNPVDSSSMRHGRFGTLIGGDMQALGKVEITDSVPVGTCQADQALRASIGISGQFCFGHRVKVLPCSGRLPRRSAIQPRGLILPTYAISRNDGEKNYCVMHADRIKVLGLQEGEFARLFVGMNPTAKTGSAVQVNAITIRVFSGSAIEVNRFGENKPYPDRSELYLDKDARQQLGLSDRSWERTPVLIRPALWRALASRALFYGLTVLLGIGAVFQVLQAFEPHWKSYVDAIVALVASAAITIILSVIDLRSRFRY